MSRAEFLATKSEPTDISLYFWSVPADAFGAWGQWAAAILTFGGLWLVVRQIRDASRTADFNALLEYLDKNREFSAALQDANANFEKSHKTDDDFKKYRQAFLTYCNFAEMQAAAVRKNLVGPATREMMREKLVAMLAYIRANAVFMEIINSARVHDSVYKHLFDFEQAHKDDIKDFEKSLVPEEKDRLNKLKARQATEPVTPPAYVQPTASGWTRHYRVAQYVYKVLRGNLDRIFGMK